MMRALVLSVSLHTTVAFNLGRTMPAASRFAVSMFNEPEKEPADLFEVKETIKARVTERTGSIVVTDGSGSFFNSRGMIQHLHDFGKYESIVAAGCPISESKKVLLSRQARYSGLIDCLDFREDLSEASFAGAHQWLAINADETSLSSQISAAQRAGVERAFILVSNALANIEDITSALEESGLTYTLMRTGPLIPAAVGGGLTVSDIDLPVCEDVPKDEVFRFVTEALTLPSAHGRVFSLCPSTNSDGLKQMRLAGYDRRAEIDALLLGKIVDAPDANAEEEQTEEEKELVLRSEEEMNAEREEELKVLLAKARQRGIDTQAKLAFLEAEKAEFRKEQEKYYKSPGEDSTRDSGNDA